MTTAMAGHQQLRFYDANADAEAVRISGFDGRGGEFWMQVPLAPSGAQRRAQRDECLTHIAEAIAAGLEPGQVIVE